MKALGSKVLKVQPVQKISDRGMELIFNGSADIKLVTGISDVNLDFVREYRSKDYDEKSNSFSPKGKEVEPGIAFEFPATSVSRASRISEIDKESESERIGHQKCKCGRDNCGRLLI